MSAPPAPTAPCTCGQPLRLVWDERGATWLYVGPDGKCTAPNPERVAWHAGLRAAYKRVLDGTAAEHEVADVLVQWAHCSPGSGIIPGPRPIAHDHVPAAGPRWWDTAPWAIPDGPVPECCALPMRWRRERHGGRWSCRVEDRCPTD